MESMKGTFTFNFDDIKEQASTRLPAYLHH